MDEFYLPKINIDIDEMKSFLKKMEEKKLENLNSCTPLTWSDNDGIIESEQSTGEVDRVDEKVICPHCETEFDKSLLEEKDSFDKCLVCGEFFKDFVTCPECKTKIKRKVLENQKNKGTCPVCQSRLNGEKVKVNSNWNLSFENSENSTYVLLHCQECDHCKSIDNEEFLEVAPTYCQLKSGRTITCNYCDNELLGNERVVFAKSKPVIESFSVVCPTCGSHEVKKSN